MHDRTRLVTATTALALATPVATWTLAGDRSSDGFTEDQLDHLFRAPAIPWLVEVLAGAAAVAVVVASAAVLGRAVHQGRLSRPWLGTVVPLAAAGAVLGYGGRLVTAGGIGANIGGAMFLFIGLPIVGILVAAAAVNAWVERRRGS
jgi:hypothetical protein